jgi:NO-binding membrane sensor protein with MHYT domain
MGLVGIWCMHFIGNRSIVLGNGDPSIQLVYAPTWTVLSVFLPVIGLTIAFSAAEFSSLSPILHWVALTCTGVFAGLSVTSMHYLGNIGITNYYLAYRTRFLVASVIIAVGDCWAVLLLFYRLREKWISSWWKRLLCAALLAGGGQ